MQILLLGGTGHIGSRVRDEALSRGHAVTAVARHVDDLAPEDGLRVERADASDAEAVRRLAEGHDVLVAALSPRGAGGRTTYLYAIRAALDAASATDQGRVLIVGGAGSLRASDDTETELLDTPDFPEEYRDEAEAGRAARDLVRASEATWTVLSPPLVIEPGERTGRYQHGSDYLLTSDDGSSRISTEDFAVALVDELEQERHPDEQFTVAH